MLCCIIYVFFFRVGEWILQNSTQAWRCSLLKTDFFYNEFIFGFLRIGNHFWDGRVLTLKSRTMVISDTTFFGQSLFSQFSFESSILLYLPCSRFTRTNFRSEHKRLDQSVTFHHGNACFVINHIAFVHIWYLSAISSLQTDPYLILFCPLKKSWQTFTCFLESNETSVL